MRVWLDRRGDAPGAGGGVSAMHIPPEEKNNKEYGFCPAASALAVEITMAHVVF